MDKIITFGILGLLIYYKFFGGKERLDAILNNKPNTDNSVDEVSSTSKCASCGIYMTEDDALIYHKKAYCSNECVEKSKRLR